MTPPELYPYQKQAVEFLHARKSAGLLLDMGLGKTCICLTALTPEHLPAIVNAPKRVAEEVWPVEGTKWRPDLRVVVAKGTPAQRAKVLQQALDGTADVVVIGRENLADVEPYAHAFRTHIIDELSGFKSPKAARFKVAKRMTKVIPHTWGLTGTPSPNGYLDLWAQVFLLDQGEALGKYVTHYRTRYFAAGRSLPNGVVTEWNIRPGAKERINTLLEPTCLSMATEGRVKLPPLTVNNIDVPLPPGTRRLYKELKKERVINLEMLGGVITSALTAATLTSKLAQMTAGFVYADDASLTGSGQHTVLHRDKVDALMEIQEGTGSQLLVAYQFQAELEMLKKGLGKLAHTIDEPGIIPAWNAAQGDVPVLLAHPQSAGHGLNLQHGGNVLVWASLTWSLEEYQQFNKRLFRNGQQHPVTIHHLVSPHTVDYAKLEVLQEKKTVQDALLEHLESPL